MDSDSSVVFVENAVRIRRWKVIVCRIRIKLFEWGRLESCT